MIAAQRHGPVRAVPVENEKVSTLQPIIDKYVNKDAHLMSDKHRSYIHIGQQFAAHSHINHSIKQFTDGDTHSNTAESFTSLLKRARIGVFHYMSRKHLSRYLSEIEFRWENRIPEQKITKSGKTKVIMKPIPIMDMIAILIMRFSNIFLRRTKAWGIEDLSLA